jgi:uncharacterized protein YlxW (UPF0749 family)
MPGRGSDLVSRVSGGSNRKGIAWLSLAAVCLGLGLLLAAQLHTQQVVRQSARAEGWEFVVADLVDSNARLREEVTALSDQLADLQEVDGGGGLLQSLVDETNSLRVINGRVAVSGPGIEVVVSGPTSVLDLQDLINELRNAGAEALALNGWRIVAWSAIGSDGQHVTVDGQPVQSPYRLQAIGDPHTLEVALLRTGGLVDLIQQYSQGVHISTEQVDKLTLPVYAQPFQFAYARPVE